MSWNLDDLGEAFGTYEEEDLSAGAGADVDAGAANRHTAAAAGARSLPQRQQLPLAQQQLQQSSQAYRATSMPVNMLPASKLQQKLQFYVQRAGKWPTGEKLKALREENAQEGVRECYDHEHLRRLLQFEAVKEFKDKGSKVYCNRVHGAGCKECNTCHFCRQKTVDVKTFCACANLRGQPGGPGRGIWCGNCLWMRMGENISEVLNRSDWSCPACRDICNCSNTSCLRKIRGCCDTKQLYHEADKLGYRSVAHYLIVTHLDDSQVLAGAMPRLDAAAANRRQQRQQQASAILQQQRGWTGDVPGAGASVNALHESNRRQRKLVEQQTKDMLAACEAAFAAPMDSELADLLDQGAGIGLDMLELAAKDAFRDGMLNFSTGLADLAPNRVSPNVQSQRPDTITSNRTASTAGHQRRAAVAGIRNSTPSPAPEAAAVAGWRPGTLQAPEQFQGSTPSPHGIMSPNGILSSTGTPHVVPGRAFPILGQPDAQHGGWGVGLLGIQCFDDDVLHDRGPSPFRQQQVSTAAGGTGAAAAGNQASCEGTNSCGKDGTRTQGQPHHPRQQQQDINQQGQQHRQPLQQLPQPQNNHQQSSHQQQQGQDHKQQPQAQQQQLQRLQVDESYAPGDFPGSNAPGYGAGAGQAGAARSRRRPQQHGWLSQPLGFTGSATQQHAPNTWFAAKGGFTANRGVSDGCASNGQMHVHAFGRAPVDAAGALRSSHSANTAPATAPVTEDAAAEAPAAKRARLAAQQVAPADLPLPTASVFLGTENKAPEVQQQREPQQQSHRGLKQQCNGQRQPPQQQHPTHGDSAAAGSAALQPTAAGRLATNVLPSRLLQHLKMVQIAKQVMRLRQPGVLRVGGNSSYGRERLNKQLFDVWSAEFGTDNSQWQSAMVLNHAYGAAIGSLDKLNSATALMLELSQLLPLGDVCEDLRWRLTGVFPFLDFKLSYPPARSILLNAFCCLMTTLAQRGSAYECMATAEAALTFHASALASSNTAAAEAAIAEVQRAVSCALADMKQAQTAMLELVEPLLDAVKTLDEEFRCICSLLNGPKDLLDAVAIGPINWPAFHSSTPGLHGTAPNLAAMLSVRQLQEEEQQLERDQRRMQLQGLAEADQFTLQKLLVRLILMAKSPIMTRKVAAALLERPELGALLDIQVMWSATTRKLVLQSIAVLIQQAAPDLLDDHKWYIQDSRQLAEMLEHRQQQQQADLEQLAPDGVAQQQVLLLEQVLAGKLPQQDRLAEVRQLCDVLQKQTCLHLEQLVAAEHPSRQSFITDTLKPAQQQGEQPPQQPAQQQKWQLMHSQQLSHFKVDALAAVYTVQMQAGAKNWADFEKQLVAPASSLAGLGDLHNPNLRLLVLCLVKYIAKQAPSLVQQLGTPSASAHISRQSYGQQQQQQISPGASIPAMWLLQLWLRTVFDVRTPLQQAYLLDFSAVLACNPATTALFPPYEHLQQLIPEFQQDKTGAVRGQLVWHIAMSFAGSGKFKELQDLMSCLPQVLCACQAELESQSDPKGLLMWQRSCMPGLLCLVDTAAEVLSSCNSTAGSWAGSRRQSASAGFVVAAAKDVKDSIKQIMALISNWIRAGIEAVCTVGSGRASDGSGDNTSSGVTAFEQAKDQLQNSALADLRRYLATVVSLAGRGCVLDGISAEKWLADSTGGSRKLAQLYAAAQQQQQQLNLPCLSELLSALLSSLSADDQPQSQEQLLLDYVAKVLLDISGLSDAAIANRPVTREAAATQSQGAGVTVPLGYKSPGLLHLLLSTHIRLILEASAGKCPTPQAHARAVNAMHLVRALFHRLEPQQLQHHQLLLPCLARPLVEQMTACSSISAAAQLQSSVQQQPAARLQAAVQQQPAARLQSSVQQQPAARLQAAVQQQPAARLQAAVHMQVHHLLQKLLTSLGGQLLPEEIGSATGGNAISFDSGPIRTMSPVTLSQLQQLLLVLLRSSLQACLTLAAAAAGVDPVAVAAAVQQQAPLLGTGIAAAAAAAADGHSVAQALLPLQRVDGSAAISALVALTGPPAVVPSELITWGGMAGGSSNPATARVGASMPYAAGRPAAAPVLAALNGAAGATAAKAQPFTRPDDYEWTVARHALRFCGELVRHEGVLQQHVQLVLPSLYQLLTLAGARGKPLLQAYNHILAQLPLPLQQQWRLPDQVEMPPPVQVRRPQQQQQQQQRLCVPAGDAPAAQQCRPGQARIPQLQQQRQQCRPAASSPECASQACSAVVARASRGDPQLHQQDREDDEGDASMHKRMRIAAPTATQEFSHGGGRAASCTVVQTQPDVQQHPAAAYTASAAVAAGLGTGAMHAASAVTGADDNEDDEASSKCTTGTSTQPQELEHIHLRQQRMQTKPIAPQQQQQQQGSSHSQPHQPNQEQPPRLVRIVGEVVQCNRMPINALAYDLSLAVYKPGDTQAAGQLPQISKIYERVVLRNAVAEQAQRLCETGHVKKGMMACVFDVKPVKGVDCAYVTTPGSQLHLQCNGSSLPSSTQDSSSSSSGGGGRAGGTSSGRAGCGEPRTGVDPAAAAAATASTKTTPGAAASSGLCGAATAATWEIPPCTLPAEATGAGAAAAAAAVCEGPSVAWWRAQHRKHLRLREAFLQQQKQQARAASQLQSSQQAPGQHGNTAVLPPGSHLGTRSKPLAARTAGAAAGAGSLVRAAAQPAGSILEDSQATVKYMTLPSQMCD